MKIRIIISLCLVFVITSIILSVGSCQKHTLKIGVMPDVDSVQAAVAASLCQDAEIVLFTDAYSRSAAFRNGSIDICISDMLTAVREINGGLENKILTTTSGDYCLVSRFNSLEDCATAVGISTGTIIEFCAHKIFGSHPFNPVPISSIPARYSALLSGSVTSCILPEPYASLCIKQGYSIVSNIGQNELGVLTANEKSVKKQKQITEFLECFEKAADICNTSNRPYIERALQELSLPLDTKLPNYKYVSLPSDNTVFDVLTYLLKTDNITLDSSKVKDSFWNC